jgi:mannose-6-phosphate isomerase-like protein (cupin superfamily)
MLDRPTSDTALGAAFAKASARKTGEALIDDAIRTAPKRPIAETRVVLPTNEKMFGDEYTDNVEVHNIGGKKGRRVRVKLVALHLDDSYQFRPETEPGRIKQLETWLKERGGFDPIEAGPIHINHRSNDRYFVIDGGGRMWMALRAGLDSIEAYVYEGLDWAEEKAFFIRKNRDKRTIRVPHLFGVAASSGTEPQATIVKYLKEAKYGLERKKGDGGRALFAPTSLLHVFYLDGTGDILRKSLLDLRAAVGDQKGVDGRLLVVIGMMRFCGASRDQKRLREVLTHDTVERGNPTVSLADTFNAARSLTNGVITSRSVQSRDLNPFVFKLLAARFNHSLPMNGGFRIVPNDVLKAQEMFAAPETVARWGEKTLYKDTWSWKYCL